MKDIQKIKEFFSKPLKENTFKVGDKVTYLGHPAEITKVNKEMTGAITYNVSYDKGNGKTKATNIYNKDGEIKSLNEATEEDPVDTITMDIPLFLRMLEYAKEDAQEDMDLHDVTEKANTLGKEKGILSMEDYDAIVGAAEEVNEASDYFKRRKAQDDYAVSKQDKPKKPYNPNSSGKTDYMKRREKELAEVVLAKLKK